MENSTLSVGASPTHVYIPHDGPLNYYFLKYRGTNVVTLENVKNDNGINEAVTLLKNYENSPTSKYADSVHRLLKSLLPVSSEIRAQLKALQTYRSNLLHYAKEIETGKTGCLAVNADDDDKESIGKYEEPYCLENMVMGLYRILLELALSCHTPTSMRRALASCMDCIQQKSCLFSLSKLPEKLEHIRKSVIESVLFQNTSGIQLWKDPLQSFFEICNLFVLKQTVKKGCSLNDATATQIDKNYINAAIQLFLEYGSQILPTLQQFDINLNLKRNEENDELGNPSRQFTAKGNGCLKCIEQGSQISSTMKLLSPMFQEELNNMPDVDNTSLLQTTIIQNLEKLEMQIFFPMISSSATNGDVLSATGAALSQLLMLRWNLNLKTANLSENESTFFISRKVADKAIDASQQLPTLNALALIKGLIASIPQRILICNINPSIKENNDTIMHDNQDSRKVNCSMSSNILFHMLSSYILEQARVATDTAIRLSSFKGLETVLSRLYKIILSKIINRNEILKLSLQPFLTKISDVVFHAWESPISRAISAAAANIFENLVKILEKCTSDGIFYLDHDVECDSAPFNLEYLVRTVLIQPENRKGRYVALDILLPLIGARKLIELSSEYCSHDLVSDLIICIGGDERGNNKNSGVIADFLRKLLSHLRIDMSSTQKVIPIENKKARRRKARELKNNLHLKQTMEEKEASSQLPSSWIEIWANPLASALLFSSFHKRSKTATSCLPVLSDISGNRVEAPHAFCALLEKLEENMKIADKKKACHENVAEHYLWAKLEVAKYASSQNLIKSSPALRKAISNHIPITHLEFALIHTDYALRLPAFSCIDTIVISHFPCATKREALGHEIRIWMESLRYACKCAEKEYTYTLLQCLNALMYRIAVAEDDSYINRQIENVEETSLLQVFVCDFLITELSIKQGMYPGTVFQKEDFILSLLRHILGFVSERYPDYIYVGAVGHKIKKLNQGKGKKTMTVRRFSEFHFKTINNITCSLLSKETLSSLLSLLHSIWDRTRSNAFNLMRDILHFGLYCSVRAGQRISLPALLSTRATRSSLYARGVHLASSPRQRESDTGSRILAILYITSSSIDRELFLTELLNLVRKRLEKMRLSLDNILHQKIYSAEKDSEVSGVEAHGPYALPLAHGLIQALRLSVECAKSDAFPVSKKTTLGGNTEVHGQESDNLIGLYEEILSVCRGSIETSLAVVADLKNEDEITNESSLTSESETLNTSSTYKNKASPTGSSTPLNVNTGAIGANAVFASLKELDENDANRRTAIQRIIIGSWLLTKEACAALASTIETSPVPISSVSIASSGKLLLRTLSSLKHQGAAFAAHKSLEQICVVCMQSNLTMSMPLEWALYLLREISAKEEVRDSTLRRSTGIALGFLSVMRSEPPSTIAPRTTCPFVLSNLIRLSLPPKSEVESKFKKVSLGLADTSFVFPKILNQSHDLKSVFVGDEEYKIRSRVHALNILRLAILDAPLASEIRKFVGDGIISALLGYNDKSWAVRNSSTMVFSAAMLRVIDADKNASSSEHKSDYISLKSVQGSANAVTARELFRSYPHLCPFLVAALKESMSYENETVTHPSLYPILLLLSRIQAVCITETDDGIQNVISDFISPVLNCLGHRQHKIRVMASRAIAKLCFGDGKQVSSRRTLLVDMMNFLCDNDSPKCWNKVHGSLLAIQTLLKGASDKARYLGGSVGLSSILIHFTSWKIDSSYPPPCSMIAMQTLKDAQLDNTSLSKEDISQFEQAIWDTLLSIEAVKALDHSLGLAQLRCTTARVCCQISIKSIFDLSEMEDKVRYALEKVRYLIQSSNFDIRVAAIKALKKTLKAKMKETILKFNENEDVARNIIVEMCKILINALYLEWEREFDPNLSSQVDLNEDGLGYHPPSLRRLSRCLIDCLDALRQMKLDSLDPLYDKLSFEESWRMIIDLRKIGGPNKTLNEERNEWSESENTLSGNAIELMGILISHAIYGINDHLSLQKNLLSKIDLFTESVKKSSDPLSLWVVRHSSATAIRNCGLLKWSLNDLNLRENEELSKQIERKRIEIFMQTILLLQDDDRDVRFMAGLALNEACTFTQNEEYHTIPLLALEKSYNELNRHVSGEEMFQRCINQLYSRCNDLEEKIEFILDEFSNSEDVCKDNSKEVTSILNLSSKRKIFEIEDANPFEEDLVITQLAASAIINRNYDKSLENDIAHNIFLKGKYLLKVMKDRISNDIAHELTLCASLFSGMFAVLSACICVIYVGIVDEFGVIDDAKVIAQKLECEENSIHPSIQSLIQILSKVQPRSNTTKEDFIKCCFLLPLVQGASK